jgi:hypothetical protein
MSESKFTPGPWKKFSRWNDRYLAVIDSIPDRDGAVVANCICHVALTNDDCVANANLIAAAPEMLACLEELLEWICSGYDASIYDIEEAARVVQKAKGEA